MITEWEHEVLVANPRVVDDVLIVSVAVAGLVPSSVRKVGETEQILNKSGSFLS
jgi:hypothetical protein